ncbi:beta-galactosidase [Micromonospora sp. BQ11]|uniref:beta-galactosidase n=1 Tax=Micromonospora sp. BQ11 TaxID=3452212 RepID=UPI003F8AFE07
MSAAPAFGPRPQLPSTVLFGAAYYTEYQLTPRLDADLDLMREAGFSVIRVGESVWSTWEPRDGVFALDWLQPVLDGARARDIDVILGTPTYAVPPWLRRKYPETTAQRRTGEPIPYGHRQDVDYSHPAYRYHAERVIRRVVGRYADHPAVIGYQVDNEPGGEVLHNPALFAGFVERLRERYGDVERLNDEWGLTYWSHRIDDWAELWTPDGNTTPAYDLAWRRYQAEITSDFIHWQAGIVREIARPEQFVTTCLQLGRLSQDFVHLAGGLDVATSNIYYRMQDAFALPANGPEEPPGWIMPGGGSSIMLQADLTYGLRGEQFLVTETNAGSIDGSDTTYPAYDGQWRQAAWAMVARGARMVAYWHWHTNHFGHETYWGGVLGHSLEPARTYREVARLGTELRVAGGAFDGYVPDADVTVLYDHDSAHALRFMPPFSMPDGSGPDPDPHGRVLGLWYRALFSAGLSVAMRTPAQLGTDVDELVRERPVILVPALYVADDATLDLLAAYAEAGGHLVLGLRPGYADTEARPRVAVMPGKLRQVAGLSYTEFSNLATPLPVHAEADSGLVLPPGAGATRWADGVVLEGARTLVRYEHPHFGRWPAVTDHEAGAGRVTYVGTLPDERLAAALAGWLRPVSARTDPWRRNLPASVTVTGGTSVAGRLRVVHNWSWEPARIDVPVAASDLLSGLALEAGEPTPLGPWDVRVFVERTPPARTDDNAQEVTP